MNTQGNHTLTGRRDFLTSVAALLASPVLTALPGVSQDQAAGSLNAPLTVRQVIDLILKEIPGAPFAKTVDQLRAGNLDQTVTGIVTTMFPTLAVIEKTAQAGANLIIAHETPFYNNEDQTDWLQQDDAYRYKVERLTRHQIAVWRFHDYWHAHKPDGIVLGNLLKLGWDKLYDGSNPRMITLPEPMPLQSIVALTKQNLGVPSVRIVGNLDQLCRSVYLAFGYMDSKRQIAAIQEYKPDVILSGETREWETVERVRDGLFMGQKTSLVVLSHAVSEEAGMEYAARWLGPKMGTTRVSHIASGSPFQFV